MQYFKVAPGKYVEYDETSSEVRLVVKEEVSREIAELTRAIGDITPPTEKELAEIGRIYHPYSDDVLDSLQEKKLRAEKVLKELK